MEFDILGLITERRAFCGDKKLKKVKLNKKVKVGKKAFLFTKVKGQKTT